MAGEPKISASPLEMDILSDPGALSEARKRLEAFCTLAGLDQKASNDLGLCFNEALANIMVHAYSGATDRPIHIVVHRLKNGVKVSIRDWGSGVNPAHLASRPKDPAKPGGLGLICLRAMCDECNFLPQPDGMLLEMVKRNGVEMKDLNIQSEMIPEARQDGDTVFCRINGEIDLHSSPELRTELLDILQKINPKKLILNLAQVPYMDSSAIAVLVESLQKMRKTGGKIALIDLQPRVKGLLEIARLNTIFIIAKDEAEALSK